MNTKNFLALTLALVLSGSLGMQFAAAQDATVDAEGEVRVAPGALPRNPLKLIKDKANQVKDTIRIQNQEFREERKEVFQGAVEVKKGMNEERKNSWQGVNDDRAMMHAEVKAEFDAATTPQEKQAVLENARKDRAEFRMQVKTDATEMRAGFKAGWKDVRASARELIADRFSTIMHRLVNALERFDQILARIDSRIEKLRAGGVDVSAAVSASATASASIDSASAAVADAKLAIETAASSETPREHIREVRAAVRAAVETVKAAHQALKDALRVLKSILPKPDASASVEVEGSVDVNN